MTHDPRQIAAAWARERPGTPVRSIPVVTAIKRAARSLAMERERVLRELGVDAATLDLLSVLRRSGSPYELTTRQITERTLVTAGAISQRIARAERDHLVWRWKAEGKTVMVQLTDQGHALVERSVDQVLAADDAAIAALSVDDLAVLQTLLARVK